MRCPRSPMSFSPTPATGWRSRSSPAATSSPTVRTGRASPHLLDRIVVDYYGAETPLKQLANVAATGRAPAHPDARTTRASIKTIEKAIIESDLGLTPNNDGNVIRLQIPELNEERRREMVRVVHGVAEEGQVAVRNIRRDVMHDLRELKKEGEVGEDDEHRAEEELQKLTDGATTRSTTCSRARKKRSSRFERRARSAAASTSRSSRTATGAGRRSGGCRRSRATARAPTSSRRGCGRRRARDRGAHRVLVLDRELVAPAGRGRGPDGDVRRADRLARRPSSTTRACGCASSAAATGSPTALRRADGVGRGADRRERAGSRCSSPSTTAAGPRSSTRREASRAATRRSSAARLYAPEMHDPDLLIRTSGEQRLSNFLLWQCAYSELVFRDELWPDFDREAFEAALEELPGAAAPVRRRVRSRAWTSRPGRRGRGERGARLRRRCARAEASEPTPAAPPPRRRERRRRPPRAGGRPRAAPARSETLARVLSACRGSSSPSSSSRVGGLIFAAAMVVVRLRRARASSSG